MHKILQNHLLCAFVANLKIDAIYAFDPKGFCDKNLAIRKVFAFSDSGNRMAARAPGGTKNAMGRSKKSVFLGMIPKLVTSLTLSSPLYI